jgi:predicted dehydrogenase
LFASGAGPLFDLGPYYLSTLATIFGQATRVAGLSRQARQTRTIGSGPRQGAEFPVQAPTYTAALVEYAGGQVAQLLFTWDSPLSRQGFIEITGTEATLAIPDPNGFGGSLHVRRAGDADWTVIPSAGATAGRGMGVVDMARSIATGQPHRASGELALHVLELMAKITQSGATGQFEPVRTTFGTPAPLSQQWDPYAPAT